VNRSQVLPDPASMDTGLIMVVYWHKPSLPTTIVSPSRIWRDNTFCGFASVGLLDSNEAWVTASTEPVVAPTEPPWSPPPCTYCVTCSPYTSPAVDLPPSPTADSATLVSILDDPDKEVAWQVNHLTREEHPKNRPLIPSPIAIKQLLLGIFSSPQNGNSSTLTRSRTSLACLVLP
jgi:hypothetical protein